MGMGQIPIDNADSIEILVMIVPCYEKCRNMRSTRTAYHRKFSPGWARQKYLKKKYIKIESLRRTIVNPLTANNNNNNSIVIFTHLKLCLADAIHNFK